MAGARTERTTGDDRGFELRLDSSAATPGTARRRVRQVLQEWRCPPPTIDTVLLVVSELVTNAHLHGTGPLRVTVRLVRPGPGVRVEVVDTSDRMPTPRHYSADAVTGRGLALVDALAAQWGAEPQPGGGKVVWAVVGGQAGERDLPRDRPATTGPDDHAGQRVVFRNVPVATYLELQAANDAFTREAELLGAHSPAPSVTGPLAELAERSARIVTPRDQFRRQVEEAAAAGRPSIDLERSYTAADLAAARRFLQLCEEVERLCEEGVLLFPPSPPAARALRRWFVEELARQLGAAPAT